MGQPLSNTMVPLGSPELAAPIRTASADLGDDGNGYWAARCHIDPVAVLSGVQFGGGGMGASDGHITWLGRGQRDAPVSYTHLDVYKRQG